MPWAAGLFVAGVRNAALLCRVDRLDAQIHRHLLPWDRPLPAQAVEWLAQGWSGGGPLDLSAWLVVVPTRQSGRRLREVLAEFASGRGSAVLAPRVMLPEDLLVPDGPVAGRNVATKLEAQLAWTRVLRGMDLEEFRALFPLDPPTRHFSWASRLAAQLQRLQATLAENGLRLGDVATRAGADLPEGQRWQELGELERRFDAELEHLGLIQLQVASIRLAQRPELPEGIKRIAVLGTPDPRTLAVDVLAAFAKQVPIDVVVFGPPGGLELFDEWGRPIEARWKDRPLALDFSSQVRLCADPADQATQATALVQRYPKPDGILALGLADMEVGPALGNRLRALEVPVFDPGGRPRRFSGLHALLKALAGLVDEPSFEMLQALARCPDFLAWVTEGKEWGPARVLEELDDLFARHLPATISAALAHTERRPAARAALDAAQALRTTLLHGSFPENASKAVATIFGARRIDDQSELAESAATWMTLLREAGQAARDFAELSVREWWELTLTQFGEGVRVETRPEGALDLLGWLELLWDDAPHVVLVGMNDGRVPESVTGDAFLPEGLRARLGLKTNEGRFARDAYLLAALQACRPAGTGRLDILVGKVAASGDPIRPSRLLLIAADADLPARVEQLFGPMEAARPAPPWRRAWQLEPRVLPPPQRVSVTAFRDYLWCPFRFYLKHVLRVEAMDPFKSELDALDFGTLCHSALEAMGKEAALRDCTDAGVLREFLLKHIDREARRRFGAELTLPLIVQLESARQRLSRVADVQAAERAAGWVIEHVERKFELPLGGVTVSAKIDRVEKNPLTGAWRVIDYKTSDQGITPRKAHVRSVRDGEILPEWARFVIEGKELVWVDLQLPLYLEALAREMGPQGGAGYFNLPKAVGETAISAWEEYDDRWQAAARRCAEGVAAAITAGTFWPPAEIPPREEDDSLAGYFHHGTGDSVRWGGKS